jgi:ABC-type branched-subunit amino acid transport system substrate-binding protein
MGHRISRRARVLCSLAALALVMAACGNSGDDTASDTTGKPTGTTFTGTDYSEHRTVDAPGVTDKEIHVGSVVSITNPTGGDYGRLNDGIDAYFATINDKGGVWGRTLKLTSKRDDNTGNNANQVNALLAQDNVYAAFIAVQLFTGANALADAGIPTFGWNINAEWAGPKNFYPNVAPICFKNCAALGRLLPWVVQQSKAHKVALIGYNVPQSSDAVKGSAQSFTQFGKDVDAQVVYQDTSLAFGNVDWSAQVAQMKSKGVDFLSTALDFNGDLGLAKEMKKQGILDKVTFMHPNLYNPEFAKQNAANLEGGIVSVGMLATQHSPAPPALREYLDYAKSHSNFVVTEMTEQGWLAARQFVEALKAAGPNFTWANLINAWNQQTRFSNGGLIPPIDWTKQHADPSTNPDSRSQFECANYVKIHNGEFEGIFDDGGAKPWVCFDGTKRNVWQDPVNVSFAGKPFDMADVEKSGG